MSSLFQSPEPEHESNNAQEPHAESAGEEIARYDEVMQQQIIALAGQMQDHERATVSLEQLESVAEEVGLEPRFVRAAARRLAAPRAPLPKPPLPADSPRTAPQPSQLRATRELSHEESLAATIAAAERVIEEQKLSGFDVGAGANGYGTMAESNLDSSPPAVLEQFRIERIERSAVKVVLRPLAQGLVIRPKESQRAWDLTGEQSGRKHQAPDAGGNLAVLHWSARLFSFGLFAVAALLTFIFYSIAFLAFFMPLHLLGKISVALLFAGLGVLASVLTRNRWQSFREMR